MKRSNGIMGSQESAVAYVIAGALLSAFGYGLFLALDFILGSQLYVASAIISFAINLVVSFFVHSVWVFQKAKPTLANFLKYFLSTQGSLWISLFLLIMIVESQNLEPWMAQLVVFAVVTPVFFLINRKFVFGNAK